MGCRLNTAGRLAFVDVDHAPALVNLSDKGLGVGVAGLGRGIHNQELCTLMLGELKTLQTIVTPYGVPSPVRWVLQFA